VFGGASRSQRGGFGEKFSDAHWKLRRVMITVTSTTVFCLPISDVPQAMGVNHVDFLSLDVEGSELEILMTINIRRIRIDTMLIEWNNGNV
jgi:FkbM family methyltransferase